MTTPTGYTFYTHTQPHECMARLANQKWEFAQQDNILCHRDLIYSKCLGPKICFDSLCPDVRCNVWLVRVNRRQRRRKDRVAPRKSNFMKIFHVWNISCDSDRAQHTHMPSGLWNDSRQGRWLSKLHFAQHLDKIVHNKFSNCRKWQFFIFFWALSPFFSFLSISSSAHRTGDCALLLVESIHITIHIHLRMISIVNLNRIEIMCQLCTNHTQNIVQQFCSLAVEPYAPPLTMHFADRIRPAFVAYIAQMRFITEDGEIETIIMNCDGARVWLTRYHSISSTTALRYTIYMLPHHTVTYRCLRLRYSSPSDGCVCFVLHSFWRRFFRLRYSLGLLKRSGLSVLSIRQ